MSRIVDAPETVAVKPAYVRRLIQTIAHDMNRGNAPTADTARAFLQVWDAVSGQDPDAAVWLIDAEPLWWLHMGSNALSVYGLDECAAETYQHPAVDAELTVLALLAEQAPVTDAALGRIFWLETDLIIAASKETP